jgi:hypothetical protein
MTEQTKGVKGNFSVGLSDLPSLRKHIKTCESTGVDTFDYKGGILYVPYAKYLVEYLTGIQKEYQ